ncbi:MAG: transketolase [Betaproteobacteria bacterium]|nr:transketolase [Betaproteobacteria bacterium]MSQ88606.1 transketolase [Betaproteobacteria bacterium]
MANALRAGVERAMAAALRALAMDAVQAANSGHPGMPMGMAEVAVALWHRHLVHNPANPAWPNRDRFVLSNGHGSMLLYSLLHLTGYQLPMAELKRFRQLNSQTPGHPERGCAPGVETTTGPLGQGISNAVGMAIAEKLLAAEFNRPGHEIVDHHTYAFLGDGCMMEGVSHEACALAGTLSLGKLIAIYDDNGISIDSDKGNIKQWYTDDVRRRFESYGWQVIHSVDGHDVEALDRALKKAKRGAKRGQGRPTLICAQTVIGKGAPTKANTGSAHGAPLGEKEIAATREAIGWQHLPFEIPAAVQQAWDARARGQRVERRWQRVYSAYQKAHPELAQEFLRRMAGELPADFQERIKILVAETNLKAETIATRKASQNALESLVPALPELIGGSADLTGSNLTMVKASKVVGKADASVGQNGGGNYLFYGVREFGMGAIMNGLALHGGLIPYGGTFLVFSDYMRNSLRMAALMGLRTIYVFTHDSLGLGEDGPTHQPIEHASSLRLIPNLDVWRPCDTTETALAWAAALARKNGPSALLLTRQNVAFVHRTEQTVLEIQKGGYVLSEAKGAPRAILIATGSEVGLALAAQGLLEAEGIPVRVVAMPSTEVFDRQTENYKAAVLIKGIPRIAIEAGVTDFWRKYVGLEGAVVGIDRYGESAPAPELFKHFGFTPENVVKVVRSLVP